MKMTVPIKGTVTDYNSRQADFDNVGISGDPEDPVVLAVGDLGDVNWQMISIDLVAGTAEIEVSGSDEAIQGAQVVIVDTVEEPRVSIARGAMAKYNDHQYRLGNIKGVSDVLEDTHSQTEPS